MKSILTEEMVLYSGTVYNQTINSTTCLFTGLRSTWMYCLPTINNSINEKVHKFVSADWTSPCVVVFGKKKKGCEVLIWLESTSSDSFLYCFSLMCIRTVADLEWKLYARYGSNCFVVSSLQWSKWTMNNGLSIEQWIAFCLQHIRWGTVVSFLILFREYLLLTTIYNQMFS